MTNIMIDINDYKFKGNSVFDLTKVSTDVSGKSYSKEEGKNYLDGNLEKMQTLQGKLYAQSNYAILIIFQAMDTGGKDSAIKHVMAGLNPQGTKVHSFKEPSMEELSHDYLWRANLHLPERGQLGIYNRSYYEDILVVRVHNLIKSQKLPLALINHDIWEKRFRQIRDYETYLNENGTIVVKIFLHISKDEQRKRLLERIDNKDKNWKFAAADLKEREYWNKYMDCYNETINNTSMPIAPWYVVPADKKWFARLVISEIIVKTMESLKIDYPKLSKEQLIVLEDCKKKLNAEK
jgi:PPK2 family polyphosphate:nucleotide phosphotransferase